MLIAKDVSAKSGVPLHTLYRDIKSGHLEVESKRPYKFRDEPLARWLAHRRQRCGLSLEGRTWLADLLERKWTDKYRTWREALVDGCEGLYELNHHVKRSMVNRRSIYELKNKMLRLLYDHGYCTECIEHIQTIPPRACWSCEGQGRRRDLGTCERCDGSGEYFPAQDVTLVFFRFEVGDRACSWHQPKKFVNFKYALTGPSARWMPENGAAKQVTFDKTQLEVAIDLLRWIVATSGMCDVMGTAGTGFLSIPTEA